MPEFLLHYKSINSVNIQWWYRDHHWSTHIIQHNLTKPWPLHCTRKPNVTVAKLTLSSLWSLWSFLNMSCAMLSMSSVFSVANRPVFHLFQCAFHSCVISQTSCRWSMSCIKHAQTDISANKNSVTTTTITSPVFKTKTILSYYCYIPCQKSTCHVYYMSSTHVHI